MAVRLLCEELSQLGHTVDVLTYHEGENIDCPRVNIHRIDRPRFVRRVPVAERFQQDRQDQRDCRPPRLQKLDLAVLGD